MMRAGGGVGRRGFLAAAGAAGATATSGCLEQLRSVVGRESFEQVSLTVKTVPADTDGAAVRIARELAKNLGQVGVDAEVLPLAEEELLRDVLVNANFDLFVARYPAHDDADFLRAALHSSFVEEPGWQNPFGYANLTVDELLVEQRRADPGSRGAVLADLQRAFVRDSPFAVVAFPDEPHAMRTDRFEGWFDAATHSKLGYLSLRRLDAADATTESPETLGVGITDGRPTRNRNPLSVEFRDRGVVTGLLYDSLGQRIDDRVEPWLAASWAWDIEGDRPVVDVNLREGLRWHDDTELTADDVAFTYRFLADTSLGEGAIRVPSPRYRGRVTLLEAVEALDERTVRLRFVPASRSVAARALTVPVLPAHVWRDRTARANIGGVPLSEYATEALVSNNEDAVGSGPFTFEQAAADELLELRRFEGHFLNDEVEGAVAPYAGRPAFDALRFVVVPSPGAALELLEAGELDATASPLDPAQVPKVGRSSRLRLAVDTMDAFYHVGFNARRPPLGNPRFRRVVARLLDREHVASDVFGGYAAPSVSPLARTGQAFALPDDVAADEGLAFPGTDGELDVEAARDLFREAGYSYRGEKLLSH